MELGICLIAKDEREGYLREWLDYHFLAGVDFVCIYDNGSAVPLKSLLSDIPNIEIVDWPGKYVQYNAYMNFIERYRHRIKWGAFIDADELIVSRCGNIKKNLEGHNAFSGLGINWRCFGSNGLIENHTHSQINAFTKRAHDTFPPNRHIKTIAKLSATTLYLSPHHFAYNAGFCANELGHPCWGPLANFTAEHIYINHYYTRSFNEYQQKLAKGRADSAAGRDAFSNYDLNEIEDLTLVNLYKSLKDRNDSNKR